MTTWDNRVQKRKYTHSDGDVEEFYVIVEAWAKEQKK